MAISLIAKVGAVFAVFLAYIFFSVPSAVVPPHVPKDSPTLLSPPWFVFKIAIGIGDFLKTAAIATTPPPAQIIDMATAYWRSEVLYALTKNGVFDILPDNSAKTCQQVAAQLNLVEHPVCEYMRAGNMLGLLNVDEKGSYSLLPTGALAQKNVPGSLRDFILMINEETAQAWRAAGTISIKEGGSGFKNAFGQEWWPWHNDHPEQEAQFDRSMKNLSFGATGAILSTWSPPKNNVVFCDIGGGDGTFSAGFLEHYPEASGIVFDQSSVTKRAEAFIKEVGLSGRLTAIGGSFFETLPTQLGSCDIFFLKYIIHDWGDEDSVTILKNVKAAAKPGAKVVLTELVLDTGVSFGMEASKALMSINMLASNAYGAKERTFEQYADLFKAAGISGEPMLLPTRDISSVIEADI